jgi:hypothetical protein
MEQKVFGVPYDIARMVDTPPSGFARIEAFFTAKNESIYVLLPRRPEKIIKLHGMAASASARVTLLESGEVLPFRRSESSLEVLVSNDLQLRLPHRDVYVIKMLGVRS